MSHSEFYLIVALVAVVLVLVSVAVIIYSWAKLNEKAELQIASDRDRDLIDDILGLPEDDREKLRIVVESAKNDR